MGDRLYTRPWLAAGLIAAITSVPVAAEAQDILYCRDSIAGTDAMEGALADYVAAHPTATVTTHLEDGSLAGCEASIGSTSYDLVIVAVQGSGPYPTPSFDAYVTGGGRAIFTDWTREASHSALFDASYTGEINATTLTVLAPHDAGVTPNPVTLANPGWGTFSMTLAPDVGATSIASLGTGSGAVLSASGNTIINGMLFDTGAANLRRFFLNEVELLTDADADGDGDGYDTSVDCDDTNAAINPGASDATCDGVDDDCDSVPDQAYVSTSSSCGVGACASTGTTSCVSGSVVDSCSPGTPAADDATCDGVDDDCDGTADEDFVGTSSTCGVGACAASGTSVCAAGAEESGCTPGTPAASDATCDGIDDDCDGTADEDGTCGGVDAGPPPEDAGVSDDDAATPRVDAGTRPPVINRVGCACRAIGASARGGHAWSVPVLLGLLGLVIRRRRRR